MAACARSDGACLNGHRRAFHQKDPHRLSRDIPIQCDGQLEGDDPSKDTLVDVSDDDENEELDEEIEDLEDVSHEDS
jgi:hypothetical protein